MARDGLVNNREVKRGTERKWGFAPCCLGGNTKDQEKAEEGEERTYWQGVVTTGM